MTERPTEEPVVLQELLDALEQRYLRLNGRSLSPDERLRAERLLRLSGPWSLVRLREGLRAILTRARDESTQLDAAFDEVIRAPVGTSHRVFTGDGAALAEAFVPSDQLDQPAPAEAPRAPRPALSWRTPLGPALGLVLAALVWVAWPRPPAAPTEAPPVTPTEATPPPSKPPSVDPVEPWRGDTAPDLRFELLGDTPGPPWGRLLVFGLAALSLLGLGALSWRVEQENLPVPESLRFGDQDHQPLVLDGEAIDDQLLSAEDADQLADAVGAALDLRARPTLDLRRSIQATIHHLGYPTEVLRPPTALQEVVIVRLGGLASRPLDQVLDRALHARGVPARRLRWDGELLWADDGWAPVSPDRLTEREAVPVLLLVGAAARLPRPRETLAPFHALPRVAWIELRDRRLWAEPERAVQRSLALFGADREGMGALTRWLRDGEAGTPRRATSTKRSDRTLGPADHAAMEHTLGEALLLAIAVAVCPLPVTERAFWAMRRALRRATAVHPDHDHALARLPPTTWDRLVALPGARLSGEALDLDDDLRAWLGQVQFATLPSDLRRAVLDHWLGALEEVEAPVGSERAVARQWGLAILDWKRCFEVDEPVSPERAAAAAERVRAAAAGRWGGRVRRARRGDQETRLLKIPDLSGLSLRDAWLVRNAATGEVPPRWSKGRVKLASALLFGALGAAGLGFWPAPWRAPQRDAVAVQAQGLEVEPDLAWVDEGGGPTLAARLGGLRRSLPWTREELLRAEVALGVTPEADPQRRVACLDEDTWPGWVLLRCASDGRSSPRVEQGSRHGVFLGALDDLADPTLRRLVDLQLASGELELAVLRQHEQAAELGALLTRELMSSSPLPDVALGALIPFSVDRSVLGQEREDRLQVLGPPADASGAAELVAQALTNDHLLPRGPVRFSCLDRRRRQMSCAWRARWEGLKDTAPTDGWDLAWDQRPPAGLAVGGWTIETRLPDGEWVPQSVEIVAGRDNQVRYLDGDAVAEVTLELPAGVRATLHGEPWDGAAIELAPGQHDLVLTAGCGVTRSVVVAVAAEGGRPVKGDVELKAGTGTPIDLTNLKLPTAREGKIQIKAGALTGSTEQVVVTVNSQRVFDERLILPDSLSVPFVEPGCGVFGVEAVLADEDRPPRATANGTMVISPDQDSLLELSFVDSQDPCGPTRSGGPSGQRRTALKDTGAPMSFVGLTAGEFCMGSLQREGERDEHPRHSVRVSAFYIGRSEVTQAQWKAVVSARQAVGDADAMSLNIDSSNFKGDLLPVEQVSWCDAARFANALSRQEGLESAYTVGEGCEDGGYVDWTKDASGYRLPTEAEWEYAARAGTTTDYATGYTQAALARAGWYSGNSGNKTHVVCTAEVKPWGLCDLHGNVWEWTWDWYADSYTTSPQIDPTGAAVGGGRVARGGSWDDPPDWARSAYRDPGLRLRYRGFRLVLPDSSQP